MRASLRSAADSAIRSIAAVVSIHALVAVDSLRAGETTDWRQFRGPGARGVAEGKDLPDVWSATENVVWATEIPGRGWSSPVVSGDLVFLTSAISAGDEKDATKGLYFGGEQRDPSPHEHRWMVWCMDFESGKVLWSREVHRSTPATPRHIKNNHAPETQVADDDTVYSYFSDIGLFAHDESGELRWKRASKPAKTRFGWGGAASPVLHLDLIIVVNDNDDASYIEALDKKTGEVRWRKAREENSNWSTPFVWVNEKRTEIVTPGTRRSRSYGLDGELLWELDAPMSSITIATPYTAHGLLYLSSGYVGDGKRPIYAIRPGAEGRVEVRPDEPLPTAVAWASHQAAPYNPTTLVYGDLLYVLFDFGFFSCHDAKTGTEVYGKQRIRDGQRTPFTASPWAYDGKVFCLSEDGDCFVIEAGREYRLLRVNSLGEMCMATPAVARGSLFIRSFSKLWRIALAHRSGA